MQTTPNMKNAPKYGTKLNAPRMGRTDAFLGRVNRSLARQGISASLTPDTMVLAKLGTAPMAAPALADRYEDSPLGTWSSEDQLVQDLIEGNVNIWDADAQSVVALDADDRDPEWIAESYDAGL